MGVTYVVSEINYILVCYYKDISVMIFTSVILMYGSERDMGRRKQLKCKHLYNTHMVPSCFISTEHARPSSSSFFHRCNFNVFFSLHSW